MGGEKSIMNSYSFDDARTLELRKLWNLDPSFAFLNHGSYGAIPLEVLKAQYELHLHIEEQPVRFFMRELEGMLEEARTGLARLLNADPGGIAFVHNATTGVNSVVKSLKFKAGEEILITDHIYNACKNAVDFVAARDGCAVKLVTVPFPARSSQEVLDAVLSGVTSRTRLVLVDHITSPTALVFPVEELTRVLRPRGIDVLVDGAHAPGMIPLDLKAMKPTYYTGNCHKWLCAPKGSAFLYVDEERRKDVRPLVTSHGANSKRTDKSFYHLEFDWVGTDDYSPYIMIPKCIEFLSNLYPGGIREHMARNHEKVLWASKMLLEAFGAQAPCPDDMLGSMAALPLLERRPPQSASGTVSVDPVQDALFHVYKVEVPVIDWPAAGKRLVRISAQAYNSSQDYERLRDALKEIASRPNV